METQARYDAVLKEVLYRRQKQWDVFSWTASLLLGLIAGVIALAWKDGLPLSPPHKVLLSFAMVFLVGYALLWLHQNMKREMNATKIIERIDPDIAGAFDELPLKVGQRKVSFGYNVTIFGIGVVALFTIWYPVVGPERSLGLTFNPGTRPTIMLTVPGRKEEFKRTEIEEAMRAFRQEIEKVNLSQ